MPNYSFVWSAPSSGAPIVSIATYGITFNQTAINLLGRPDRVKLGYDEENNVVGVMPTTKNDPQSYPFAGRERKGYTRISNKDFINYLSSKSGLDFSTSRRYLLDYDKSEQLATINLDSPMEG